MINFMRRQFYETIKTDKNVYDTLKTDKVLVTVFIIDQWQTTNMNSFILILDLVKTLILIRGF